MSPRRRSPREKFLCPFQALERVDRHRLHAAVDPLDETGQHVSRSHLDERRRAGADQLGRRLREPNGPSQLVDEKSGRSWSAKVPSTPKDQSVGVLKGLARICRLAAIKAAAIAHVMVLLVPASADRRRNVRTEAVPTPEQIDTAVEGILKKADLPAHPTKSPKSYR